VYWITAEGDVDRLPDLDAASANPTLIDGAGGRPFLVAANPDGTPSFFQFDPWATRFVPIDAPAPPSASATRYFTVDPGLFVWLGPNASGDATEVHGFRHGTRGPYTQAVTPLLLSDTEGTSPDRAPRAGSDPPSPSSVHGSVERNAATSGNVALSGSASLVVTDTTYEAFDLSLDVQDGPPPVVRLSGASFGGTACPWPDAAPPAPFGATLTRSGNTVRLGIGTKTRDCKGPEGRVTVELSPSSAPVTIQSVAVKRQSPLP
jgi:hypothetical protein